MMAEAVWFIGGLFLMLAEMLLPGFIIFFFGLGALVTAGLVWLVPEVSFVGQGVCFSVASVVSLVLGRVCFRKALSGKKLDVVGDVDECGVVGSTGEVVEAIVPPRAGRISVHGATWLATAEREIGPGEAVRVVARENITLIVR